jgi:hypothetical protein
MNCKRSWKGWRKRKEIETVHGVVAVAVAVAATVAVVAGRVSSLVVRFRNGSRTCVWTALKNPLVGTRIDWINLSSGRRIAVVSMVARIARNPAMGRPVSTVFAVEKMITATMHVRNRNPIWRRKTKMTKRSRQTATGHQ